MSWLRIFGIKDKRSDQENWTRAMNKYDTVLTDQLAELGYANNWNNPATARFLNEEGAGLLPAAFFGEATNARGHSLSDADRRWFATAVARDDVRAHSYFSPMQYAIGNAPYQPFGNYSPYVYDPFGLGNSFANSNFGWGSNFGNQFSGFGQDFGFGNQLASFANPALSIDPGFGNQFANFVDPSFGLGLNYQYRNFI